MLRRLIERGWYRPGTPPLPLRVLSCLFAGLAALRRALYRRGLLRSERLPVPVLVIGNLSVGGAGKTPLAIAVATWLRANGWNPGVVSRGYGRRNDDARVVRPDDSAADVGDEPLEIAASSVPVAVAPRRADAGRLLLEAHGCDVLIADDGLQHYALARDVEVLVIDGRRGLGNGQLLPAGPLREPERRAQRCDFVVVNGGPLPAGAHGASLAVGAVPMRLEIDHVLPLSGGDPLPLEHFAGSRVHAVAGIGDPPRFFAALRSAGLVVEEHAFPDHHEYRAHELAFAEPLPVLMTAKDATKCRAFAQPHWYSVPVTAILPEEFLAGLQARLRAARTRHGAA